MVHAPVIRCSQTAVQMNRANVRINARAIIPTVAAIARNVHLTPQSTRLCLI